MTERHDQDKPQASTPPAYHHAGGNLPAHSAHDRETISEAAVERYWRDNIRLVAGLLAVWFLVSFVFAILFVDELNAIPLFGFKLGFWWAQQGSIFVFVGLIFAYSILMKRLERRYGVDDDEERRP